MATYGRGKFDVHKSYVDYMEMIVEHPHYEGMPNVRGEDGRVKWQVSSGETTSFYADYLDRWEWWATRADALGLPGRGNSDERFTIAARIIHPTGYRACRLCGRELNVGYFYLNSRFAAKLNKLTNSDDFAMTQSIEVAIEKLSAYLSEEEVFEFLAKTFPERASMFRDNADPVQAFEASRHVRTYLLSPGFMGNPPDRLDGLHDYCSLYCRKKHDPGRSDSNMRSYIHDRRAFYWWAEGDWNLADKLFNSAGGGVCGICGASVEKISPDHVGPLSCGFKQVPYFFPMCSACNSSKNRRMTMRDIGLLVDYEHHTRLSVASWQVRGLWDAQKGAVESNRGAQVLSTYMRSLQDYYMRTLFEIYKIGKIRFLAALLNPQYALYNVSFVNLDPATLTFDEIIMEHSATRLKQGLAARSVRVSFESLVAYAEKEVSSRKLRGGFLEGLRADFWELRRKAQSTGLTSADQVWAETIKADVSEDEKDRRIRKLLEPLNFETPMLAADLELRGYMADAFVRIGTNAELPL